VLPEWSVAWRGLGGGKGEEGLVGGERERERRCGIRWACGWREASMILAPSDKSQWIVLDER